MPMGRPHVYRRDSESEKLELPFKPDVSGKQNAWLPELVCKFPNLRYTVKNGEQRIGLKKFKKWMGIVQKQTQLLNLTVIFIMAANV